MLSLILSFVLYGHTLNTIQSIGLLLAVVAMIANFYEKVRPFLYCLEVVPLCTSQPAAANRNMLFGLVCYLCVCF